MCAKYTVCPLLNSFSYVENTLSAIYLTFFPVFLKICAVYIRTFHYKGYSRVWGSISPLPLGGAINNFLELFHGWNIRVLKTVSSHPVTEPTECNKVERYHICDVPTLSGKKRLLVPSFWSCSTHWKNSILTSKKKLNFSGADWPANPTVPFT